MAGQKGLGLASTSARQGHVLSARLLGPEFASSGDEDASSLPGTGRLLRVGGFSHFLVTKEDQCPF